MTNEEWLAACLATRPPLTQAQIAVMRPIFRPLIPVIEAHTKKRSPAPPPGTANTRNTTPERVRQ